ncbi:MAG TPA: CxxxxCH/CxxCH domain-containing protein [Polyangiaceae bacterium]
MRAHLLGASLLLAVACAVERADAPAPPTWDDVAPLLQAKCASCHAGAGAAASYRVGSYVDAIACVSPSGAAATLPSDATAPIVATLAAPPHVGLLDDDQQALLLAWIDGGAPAIGPSVHPPGFANPRSSDFHAASLRAARWRPMLDPSDPGACGRCHDGTLSRPASVTVSAPDAPSCATCHDQPGGIVACGTCHGTRDHAYPPRDSCFFPNDPPGGAHAAHVEPSSLDATGLACSTCHPTPSPNAVISGSHGDGAVEIAFDPSRVTPEASWDSAASQCAVACHDRGGARPHPKWNDATPMGCNDCHASPPAKHFQGPCTTCHAEANATGTALAGGALHMNGKVDLGDGSGKCGACHGSGDDPWPRDATHQAHANPSIAAPVACGDCHVVPSSIFAPGHLDAPLSIRFSGHALDRGAVPTFDGTTCRNVACHGANLADPPASPAWSDTSGAQIACSSCHPAPPSEHTTSTDCNRSICHGAEVSPPPNLGITPSGRSLHVNGVIDVP